MYFIVLFIAISIAISVGKDAKKRGMNSIGWGTFVFLILIIGLPAYFIARKPLLENQNTESDSEVLD